MILFILLFFHIFFVEANQRETLIFIDKSESVKYMGLILERAKSEIEEIIVQRFYKGNDGIKVYFIHGNTSASKPSQTYKVLPPNCDAKLPSLKKQLCLSNYQKELNKKRKIVLDSLVKTLQLEASNQTKNSTDIFGAIETACIQKKMMLKSKNNSDLDVHIFSDMIQTSSSINLKNIGQLSLSSVRIKVDKDLKVVRNNYLNLNKIYLEGIIVHVRTPELGINNPAYMKNLRFYWEEILNKLGVEESNIFWD